MTQAMTPAMTPETLFLLALFVVVMVGSPGPANALFLASGATVGVRRTLPFLAGTLLGFAAVGIAIALGLNSLLEDRPDVALVLSVASLAYMLYLAWRIATAPPLTQSSVEPLGFRDGLALHPLNPKAWVMLTAAFAQFATPSHGYIQQAAIIVAAFVLLGAPLNVLWAVGGEWLTKRITSPALQRGINLFMGTATAVVVLALVLGGGAETGP